MIGFHKATEPFEFDESKWFEHEKPSVLEAFRTLCKEGYYIAISEHDYVMRKKRLEEEYEKNTKAPGPDEEQAKEDNPALKESASQFNDALLDAQAKKIKSLVNDITHMDNVIYKKNLEIDKQNKELTRLISLVEKKENSISRLYYEKSVLEKENEDLKKGEIPARYFDKALVDEQEEKIKKLEHEKLDILEMVSSCKQTIAELTKEKTNLEDQITILNACKEHNENFGRKQIKRLGKEVSKLNSIIHDKNAVLADVAEELRLSKIREKNLAELGLKYVGENEELKKELADKVVDEINAKALKSAESALAWKEKTITYKDMALAYYEKKIAEKDEVIADLGNELAATKKKLEEKTQLVEIVRNASKDYCDYGVAANEFIKKLANLYVTAGNKGTISNEMFERCKNYQTYGFPATCNKETKKEIDDIARGKENKKPRIHTPEISEEELMKIQEKVVAFCDIAEEGGDYSATIVQCGNGITLSKEEAEIIERCTKNGTELHYSEKDGLTYTNVFGEEMPIRCLRGMFHAFTDEEIENMKK